MAELFVPAQTLDYGTYELIMKVTMAAAPQLVATASAYVTITSSAIVPNLMPFGTSTITLGRAQDLLLDPGTYSHDPDAFVFNASVSVQSSSDHLVKVIPAAELELRVLLPYP